MPPIRPEPSSRPPPSPAQTHRHQPLPSHHCPRPSPCFPARTCIRRVMVAPGRSIESCCSRGRGWRGPRGRGSVSSGFDWDLVPSIRPHRCLFGRSAAGLRRASCGHLYCGHLRQQSQSQPHLAKWPHTIVSFNLRLRRRGPRHHLCRHRCCCSALDRQQRSASPCTVVPRAPPPRRGSSDLQVGPDWPSED